MLDHTSFYADSGGQVGDTGWLYSDDHNIVVADVLGCVQPVQGVRAHKVFLRQPIELGSLVDTVVDTEIRSAIRRNHTGTHLFHAGLREVLGKHVKQAGSRVDPEHLRFDFSHFTGVAEEELAEVEEIINRQVLANTKVETLEDVPIDVAVNEYHAMALFGEKYGEKVRVVKIGDFSTELCGGTHTAASGEIGLVKLLSEGGVSSGVRRVEAVTGLGALGEFRRDQEVAQLAGQFAGEHRLPRRRCAASSPHKRKKSRSCAASLTRPDEVGRLIGLGCQPGGHGRRHPGARAAGGLAGPRADANSGRQSPQQARVGRRGSGLGAGGRQGRPDRRRDPGSDLPPLRRQNHCALLRRRLAGPAAAGHDMAKAGGKDASALNAALASAPEVVRELLGKTGFERLKGRCSDIPHLDVRLQIRSASLRVIEAKGRWALDQSGRNSGSRQVRRTSGRSTRHETPFSPIVTTR